MTEQPYTITKARYAKGMIAVACPGIECSMGTIKSRAGNLASHLAGNRYSNREKAYIMTPTKVSRFLELYKAGYDACVMTKELLPPEADEVQCPTCGDHHEPDAVPFTCETGDGV